MKETVSIKSSRDFTRTIKRGKSVADRFLIVCIFPNKLLYNKIGISIGKKVGKSVKRNRVKRLIRENYRLIKDNLKTGNNIVFIPREASSSATFYDIKTSMDKLFKKIELYLKK